MFTTWTLCILPITQEPPPPHHHQHPEPPDWSAQSPPPLAADVLSRLLFSPPPHLFLFSIFESIGGTVGRRPPAVLLRV